MYIGTSKQYANGIAVDLGESRFSTRAILQIDFLIGQNVYSIFEIDYSVSALQIDFFILQLDSNASWLFDHLAIQLNIKKKKNFGMLQ